MRSSIVLGLQYLFNIDNNQNIIRNMLNHRNDESPHKKYSKISLKKRQILIDLIVGKGESLTKTSKKLSIKLSTAKLILRKYRKTGELFNKNMSAKAKKQQRTENKSKQIGQYSQICKRQEFQEAQDLSKVKLEQAEIMKEEMINPAVYYPPFECNWVVYPYFTLPYQL